MTVHFASTFYALTNAMGSLPSALIPYAIGFVLESGDNLVHQWNIAFYAAGVCAVLSMAVFVLGVHCELEPWDTMGAVMNDTSGDNSCAKHDVHFYGDSYDDDNQSTGDSVPVT